MSPAAATSHKNKLPCPSSLQEKISKSSLLDQTKITSFDDVLERVGSCGKFQLSLFMLMGLTEVALAWAMFQPVFIATTPVWTCESLVEYNNTVNNSWTLSVQSSTDDLCELVLNNSCGHIIFSGDYSTIASDVSQDSYISALFLFHHCSTLLRNRLAA
jgi:hypothetical protein